MSDDRNFKKRAPSKSRRPVYFPRSSDAPTSGRPLISTSHSSEDFEENNGNGGYHYQRRRDLDANKPPTVSESLAVHDIERQFYIYLVLFIQYNCLIEEVYYRCDVALEMLRNQEPLPKAMAPLTEINYVSLLPLADVWFMGYVFNHFLNTLNSMSPPMPMPMAIPPFVAEFSTGHHRVENGRPGNRRPNERFTPY